MMQPFDEAGGVRLFDGKDKSGAWRTMCILVIEESAEASNTLVESLRACGVEKIELARGGGEAIDKLRRHRFDLVFSALDFTGMDSVEMLRYFGQHLPIPPLVIISDWRSDMLHCVLRMAEQYGLPVAGFLPKPVTCNELYNCLQRNGKQENPIRGRNTLPPVFSCDELFRALENKEIHPWFQPKHEFKQLAISGVETLVRWQHPSLGLLSPALFLPEIMRHGLADALFESILEQAVRLGSRWHRLGFQGDIAVNVDPSQLSDSNLADRIKEIVGRHQLPPQQITIELTEIHELTNWGAAIDNTLRLRMMSFNVALDDFGSGYSNLLQLRDLPVNSLKIDRMLVDGAASSQSSIAVLRSAIQLARAMNVPVVAEGVERSADLALLRELQVDNLQGFLLSRPMSAPSFFNKLGLKSRSDAMPQEPALICA